MANKELSYSEAELLLKAGKRIKLPEWGGYWFKDKNSDQVLVLTKDGEVLDTPDEKYKDRNDWEVAKATPQQNKIVKAFYESTPVESKKEKVPKKAKSQKVWVKNPKELVRVEKTKQALKFKDKEGKIQGGNEYYGKRVGK